MSYHRRYKLKDDRFGLLALSLREKAHLTQTEVARVVGISERTVRHWEGGTAYPDTDHLKQLIELYLIRGAFAQGRERDEAKALWEQAVESASRRKTIFDETWFAALLKQRVDTTSPRDERPQAPDFSPSHLRQVDWGEAIDVASFYGREQELAELERWILKDRCRVVTLLGMGGIGKTTLSVKLAQQLAPHFEFVFWRSLRNAPPLQEIVADCIQTLSEQRDTSPPQNVEKGITLVIELLRKHRCLLVLDNIETLLQAGNVEGSYHQGYENYRLLFQRVAETAHQSCLLLTSREMLNELEPLMGTQSPVRGFKVFGLGRVASQQMLKDRELFGTQNNWKALIEQYSGNPLALKIVAATVQDLFGGDISAFLHREPGILHTVRQLLDTQFERLAPLERDVMYWLALEREPASIEELSADLLHSASRKEILTALKALRRRSLIERGEQGAVFTQQQVVMEYVGERLVEQVCAEVNHGEMQVLVSHALMKAQSKDYIRESQVRMLVKPVLEQLCSNAGSEQEVEQQLLLLVRSLQGQSPTTHGYGGGNMVNLLAYLKGHLRNSDFSGLVIRQAYVQDREAQDANFANTHISDTLFMEPIESIASMTLSPDGQYLAVGNFNGQVRVWQVADGKPLFTLTGHNRLVWTLAFSPDGTMLASGGYDRNVKLWSIEGEESGRCLKTLAGHEKWVRSVTFSPDGALLASCSDDETVRLWYIHEGRCLGTLRGHTDIAWGVTFSPDGSLLASCGHDGTVRVWDVGSGTCVRVLPAHHGTVMAVAFHPVGDMLASGGNEGEIKLWEVSTGRCLETLHMRTMRAASIAFNLEGTMLASGSFDGAVEVWQIGQEGGSHHIKTLHGHTLWVSAVAFGPGSLLASTSYNGKVRLWNVESGRCLRTFQGYSNVMSALAFSPDGKLLIYGDDGGMLKLWKIGEGSNTTCLRAFRGHTGRVWSVSFSPDGKTFASGGDDLNVKLWDASSGALLKTFHGHTTLIWSLVFSPDGERLAGFGFEHAVLLWNVHAVDGEENLVLLQRHEAVVWSVAFHPDGSLLASGDNDGKIKLWEMSSGQCLRTLCGVPSPIEALAFTADGARLLSGDGNGGVTLWEVSNGGSVQVAHDQGAMNWIKAMAWSSDGTILANGYNDHTIKLCYFKGGYSLPVFKSFSLRGGGQVWSVAFSRDGSMVASGDDEGTIVVWDTETGMSLYTLRGERPYERMNIDGVQGLTEEQKASLKVLGAIEETVDGIKE